MSWMFSKLRRGDKNRDPMQEAFFTIEDIDHHTQALVRESIQNTLDEKCDGCDNVRVRIFLSDDSSSLSPDTAEEYFSEAFPHFSSASGLYSPPQPDEPCRYLVYEDFNTNGLTGDPLDYHGVETKNNRFYFFLRAEGKSGKSNTDRGRWGIGKYVFPRSSRAKSFFAFTVRHDDRRQLLVGQSVLKGHTLENEFYSPDGWYGKHTEDYPNQPIEDPGIIEKFRNDFNLQRTEDDTGLSIIVPYLDKEIDAESIVYFILKEYYHPIYFGTLEVEVSNGIEPVFINCETLIDCFTKYIKNDRERERLEHILLLCKTGEEHIKENTHITLTEPEISNNIRITEDMISTDDLDTLKAEFHNEKMISVRIPIYIKHKSSPSDSYFDVHFQKNPALSDGIPVFIREGILIPDRAKNIKKAGDVLTVVSIHDEGIARLLGDAENPAHTEWQHQLEKMKNYSYAKSYITFVKRCIHDLVRLMSDDEEEDLVSLRDLFPSQIPGRESLVTPDSAPKKKRKKHKKKPKPDIPRSKPVYIIVESDNGVIIENTDEPVTGTQRITAKFAYATPEGDAFRKWSILDFELGADIKVSHSGSGISDIGILPEKNGLSFNITDKDFSIEIRGFDPHRDLAVRVNRKELTDV